MLFLLVVGGLRYMGTLPSDADIDTLNMGIWRVYDRQISAISEEADYGLLITISANFKLQLFAACGSSHYAQNRIYVRLKSDSQPTWGKFRKLAYQ